MTNDKGILIQNIYYMLTYAFRVLKQNNYESVEVEDFESIEDLISAILAKGISQQIKQGLYREYQVKQQSMSTLRGKLDMRETIQNKRKQQYMLSCEYDELSQNNIFNQILKTTATKLSALETVKKQYRVQLRQIMRYFDGIDFIELSLVPWNRLTFHRNNEMYEMLINLCYFVSEGLLQTTKKGTYKVTAFTEEHMEKLFERFVLEYYKKHHTGLQVSAEQITWNLDVIPEEHTRKLLPIMQTDITLKDQETGKVLIIDTKYYTKTMQEHYHTHTIHSNNLYQIFTYVKNKDKDGSGNVGGLLLYAKTEEACIPDATFSMSGNEIAVKTLDLNCRFEEIKRQLDEIVREYFRGSFKL